MFDSFAVPFEKAGQTQRRPKANKKRLAENNLKNSVDSVLKFARFATPQINGA
jgi:hypothetical protein